MTAEARCEEHVGEPFPPRCDACDLAELDRIAPPIVIPWIPESFKEHQ